jgi:hypothetical protein
MLHYIVPPGKDGGKGETLVSPWRRHVIRMLFMRIFHYVLHYVENRLKGKVYKNDTW